LDAIANKHISFVLCTPNFNFESRILHDPGFFVLENSSSVHTYKEATSDGGFCLMKFVNWLTRTIITAAIMSGISIATTWVMVNAYVQQITEQYGVAGAVQPIAITNVLSALTEGGQKKAKPVSAEAQEDPVSGSPEAPEAADPSAKEYPVPDNALPVMGEVETQHDDVYISMEDLNEKKESFTQEDRVEIFTMLITKLPPSEVRTISTLLEDGFRAEEMQEASAILKRHLTEEEYEKLIGILLKYE
jgi:hypothetical protein